MSIFENPILSIIGKVIDRVIPDKAAQDIAKLEAIKLAQAGSLAELEIEARQALGQMDVNKVEAASASLFVAGWRPAVGWVCVSGLAYQFIFRPLLVWISPAIDFGIPPELDIGDLLTLLGGMLGLGSLRTFEKVNGVARK